MKRTTPVTLGAVGLSPRQQAELAALLAPFPQVGVEHFNGWSFRLLRADVIVLGTDLSVGQEALDMLRSYRSVKAPPLVIHSVHDEASGPSRRTPSLPPFAWRLQQALRRIGVQGVVIDAGGTVAEPAGGAKAREPAPGARRPAG